MNTRHKKAAQLVDKLIENGQPSPSPRVPRVPRVPVDDIVDWAPALFDDMLMCEYEGAGVSEIPKSAWAAIESGKPASPEDKVELASWLNSNWLKLCAIEVDGEKCPSRWRRMSWTPELVDRVLSNM